MSTTKCPNPDCVRGKVGNVGCAVCKGATSLADHPALQSGPTCRGCGSAMVRWVAGSYRCPQCEVVRDRAGTFHHSPFSSAPTPPGEST